MSQTLKKYALALILCFAFFLQCKKSNSELVLSFSDEFNEPFLDVNKWKTNFDWGQSTTSDNQAFIVDSSLVFKDGMLHITAKRDTVLGMVYDEHSNPVQKEYYFTTGLIHSGYSFAQQYGYFEIRSKAPFGKGFWPAFWLMSLNSWPPEIDIFEISGQQPQGLHMSNHFRDSKGLHKQTTTTIYGPDLSTEFHVFGLEWNAREIIWYLDGKRVYSTEENIPQEKMYVIINLSMGGNFSGFADNTTPLPASLDVDYVRVYKRKDN